MSLDLQPLLPDIAARAEAIEAARHLPADIAQDLAKAGAFRMVVPRVLGGLELTPMAIAGAIETIARADASTGWCVMIGATTGLLAAYLPDAEAAAIFSDPLIITGGVFAPLGRAVSDGEHWIVSGRWRWASGSANCAWLGGGAMLFDGEAPILNPAGEPSHRMMLFPASDVDLIDTWRTAGLCGTGSQDMEVRAIRVPKRRSVGLQSDKPVAAGPLYAFPAFGLLAMGVAAVALGNARGALDAFHAVATTSKGRRPADRNVIQIEVAKAEAALSAARAFHRETIEEAWAAARAEGDLPLAARARLRLACVYAAHTSADVSRSLYDLGGGDAVFMTSELQRRFRDAHVITHHVMVAPPIYELAGRVLLDLPTRAETL